MEEGLVHQIPVKALKYLWRLSHVRLQFCRPTTPSPNPSDPWNLSCKVSDIFVFVTAY
jgi:hypothetical protein